MFQEQTILRIPGPTPVPPQVERAMTRPMIGHRSGDFSRLLQHVSHRLKTLFQTEQDVLILAGSGTAAMEAAVANITTPGDKVLVCTAGNFGERFEKLAVSYGADVIRLEAPWGETLDPQQVAAVLTAHPDIRAVYVTHCETSTGVLHDVQAIAARVRRTDALLIVDAVSSLGATPLPMDAWGLDIVITGSQKALMLPPGLGFLALSPRAWEAVERTQSPRLYFDLRAYRKQLNANTTPYTAAVSLIYGLHEALDLIEQEGLPAIFARHLLLQDMTRQAAKALGLTLYTPDDIAAPTVTAIRGDGFDPEQLRKVLREQFHIAVAGGQQHLKGRIFRIGHMGYCSPVDILQAIAALEASLARIGVPVELGQGVQAAQKVWLTQHQQQAEVLFHG